MSSMNKEKKTSTWVDKKKEINDDKHDEILEFVGELGVDFVKDGKLPNGDDYTWKKRR